MEGTSQLIWGKDEIISAQSDAYFLPPNKKVTSIDKKKLLVLISSAEHQQDVPPLVSKMMEACQLAAHEYHVLLLLPNEQYNWLHLKEQYQPAYVLSFGIHWPQLGLQANLLPQRVQTFHGCTWIVTAPLEMISLNEDLKKVLWVQLLKPTFLPR